MKIAFICFPMLGHFNPMSAVARRLQSRGHHPVIFSSPVTEPLAQAAGLDFVPYGQDSPVERNLAKTVQEFSRLRGRDVLPPSYRFLADYLRVKQQELPALFEEHGIEAVVIDDIDAYTAIIPRQLGLPYAGLACALYLDFSGNTPLCYEDRPHEKTAAARKRNRRSAADFSGMVRSIYADIIAEAESAGITADWDDPASLYADKCWITQCPREFDFDEPQRPAGFYHAAPFHDGEGRPEVDFSWEQLTGAPLVYASMGTMLNGDPSIFRTILEASAQLPNIQLVLSIGQTLKQEDLGSISANAIVVHQAPQLALLDRAALCITHAGLNTVLEALARGVPQIAIPVSYDQPGVAARITYHGTGAVASLDGLTATGLAELMREVLDNPSYRANAQRMQEVISPLDGLQLAAERLEQGLSAQQTTNVLHNATV